jgi:hypothetical protein
VRYCTNCGGGIEADAPHYYTKCRSCYRGAKQQESAALAAELEKQRELAAKYRSLAIERRLKIEKLEAQAGGVASGLSSKRVNDLLMFVHPDKHQGAPPSVKTLSNDLTRWLIEIRDKQRSAR